MLVGVSCAGASAIGGLVRTYEYFQDEKYLDIAKKACEYYYQNFVAQGVTSGGPGEILTAPDSKSAYAMVESCVILYEATKEKKWLGLRPVGKVRQGAVSGALSHVLPSGQRPERGH